MLNMNSDYLVRRALPMVHVNAEHHVQSFRLYFVKPGQVHCQKSLSIVCCRQLPVLNTPA